MARRVKRSMDWLDYKRAVHPSGERMVLDPFARIPLRGAPLHIERVPPAPARAGWYLGLREIIADMVAALRRKAVGRG